MEEEDKAADVAAPTTADSCVMEQSAYATEENELARGREAEVPESPVGCLTTGVVALISLLTLITHFFSNLRGKKTCCEFTSHWHTVDRWSSDETQVNM